MATSTTPKKRKAGSAVQTPLETYLREINETALLNAKEEKELATRSARATRRPATGWCARTCGWS